MTLQKIKGIKWTHVFNAGILIAISGLFGNLCTYISLCAQLISFVNNVPSSISKYFWQYANVSHKFASKIECKIMFQVYIKNQYFSSFDKL